MKALLKNIAKNGIGFRKWLKYKKQIVPETYEGVVPFEDWKKLFRQYIIHNGYRWGECTNILEFCCCKLVRIRVMQTPALLTKYPLFYFEKGVFEESAHYRSTYQENRTAPCFFGILHYKFTNKNDISKIKERVKNGNYYKGSLQYSEYLDTYEKKGGINLYYEYSMQYKDSSSLNKINLFDHWSNL